MSNRLSRRELAVAALAGAASRAQEKKYNGALDGATAVVDPKQFDPVAWTLDRQHRAPLKLTFQATNRKQAEVWQRQFRAKVIELVRRFSGRAPSTEPADSGSARISRLQAREIHFRKPARCWRSRVFIDPPCFHPGCITTDLSRRRPM